MTPENKARWVEALRSGKYPQGQTFLHSSAGNYCCLGVLCELHGLLEPTVYSHHAAVNGGIYFPPRQVLLNLGLDEGAAEHLASMNDSGASFAEIADYIEQNVS